jgi:capsular exopolysaccharide synthesis family protein
MSRNFELLQKAAEEREQQMSGAVQATAAAAAMPMEWVEETEGIASGSVPPAPEGHSREELTKLVQRLFLLPDSARAVVFSSVERGAGCTWLATQVARSLASHGGNRVCLVDANLRHPAVHEVFGVANHNGLADAVADSAPLQNYLRKSALPNLWLLTCGSAEKAEHALGASAQTLECIRQLRQNFDYVIVDAAPMNLYSDAVRLANAADGIALVLKANSSRREIAQRMLQEARNANVRILGAVLNQRTFPIPEKLYKRL